MALRCQRSRLTRVLPRSLIDPVVCPIEVCTPARLAAPGGPDLQQGEIFKSPDSHPAPDLLEFNQERTQTDSLSLSCQALLFVGASRATVGVDVRPVGVNNAGIAVNRTVAAAGRVELEGAGFRTLHADAGDIGGPTLIIREIAVFIRGAAVARHDAAGGLVVSTPARVRRAGRRSGAAAQRPEGHRGDRGQGRESEFVLNGLGAHRDELRGDGSHHCQAPKRPHRPLSILALGSRESRPDPGRPHLPLCTSTEQTEKNRRREDVKKHPSPPPALSSPDGKARSDDTQGDGPMRGAPSPPVLPTPTRRPPGPPLAPSKT